MRVVGVSGCARALVVLGVAATAGCSHHLSAAQTEVLRQQGFAPQGEVWQLSLGEKMLFDTGSSVLKPQTQVAVESTGGALSSANIRNVRVEGYTDNTGPAQLNRALSQARAQTVAAALDKRGMTGKVAALGLGMANPVADNATEAGRAENRRVAVIVPDDQD